MMHLPLLVMKRGIIHLCKIGILFENRDFEHDVYELIKAFYPEAEIHTLYENAEAEYDLRFSVERDNDSYIIKYERTENLSKQETEQKGVISADILSKENAGCGIQDAHALRKENKDNLDVWTKKDKNNTSSDQSYFFLEKMEKERIISLFKNQGFHVLISA